MESSHSVGDYGFWISEAVVRHFYREIRWGRKSTLIKAEIRKGKRDRLG